MNSSNVEIHFENIEETTKHDELINKVVQTCFETENITKKNIYINVILTNPEVIKITNKEFRNINKETDVLSFPMFEREEIGELKKKTSPIPEVLGDIMISIQRVQEQAIEYGHSFERELAYMLVHGFYHLMGYDHIEETDKIEMRAKEEYVLNLLNITRE